MAKRNLLPGIIISFLFITACNTDYTAKPRGYFRIGFPAKSYQRFDVPGYPYTFEYPVYGKILKDSLFFEERAENPYWINIDFADYGARLHISYKEIGKYKFDSLVNDAYQMSYKQHTYRASGIEPKPFTTAAGLEGVYFTLKGNAATPAQFFVSDSVKHFLRGALYFNATPNADSLKPATQFFEADMQHLINTLRWR